MLRKFLTTATALCMLTCISSAQTMSDSAKLTTFQTVADTVATAEEIKPAPTTITASVDVYYRYNFSNSKTSTNNLTSFTNSQNSFELGMASVKLEHSIGKVGVVADLGFGRRAKEFSYNDNDNLAAIKQLYVTYSPWENVKLTGGSWATHVGYELVDAYANRNYSMSYMFSYGPFFHTGLKADFTVGKSGFMVGLANPTDYKTASFSKKYLIAQYSVASKNDNVKAYLNFAAGKPNDSTRYNQIDLVATTVLTEMFSLGYNGTVATFAPKVDGKFGSGDSWWGTALYLNYDPVKTFGLTLRSEYFSDKHQLNVFSSAGDGGNIFANTLSGNFKIDNLTLIPELRYEHARENIYTKPDGGGDKGATSFILAAVYKF